MRISEFDTEAEANDWRKKRKDAGKNKDRPMSEGTKELLQIRWIKRIRVAQVAAKPHLFHS